MESFELRLSDRSFQNSSLAQAGIKNDGTKFSEGFMLCLGFKKATTIPEEKKYSVSENGPRVNLNGHISPLINKKVLSEVVGARSFRAGSVICYSTFVAQQPKPYFPIYCELLNSFASQTGMRAIIWLEDLVSLPRFDWFLDAAKNAAFSTGEWFRQRCNCTVLVSSESGGGILPIQFVKTVIANLEFADFLSMLPFYRRGNLSLITISDVSHCLWNSYVFSRFPGLHFTATSNKRNYMVFRKLCGKAYSVAFLHPIV